MSESRRVARDMRAMPDDDAECELDGEVLGETSASPAGYHVRVQVVRMRSLGLRVRLTLLRREQSIRSFDLTTLLCRDLAPIIEAAARLGGDVAVDPNGGPWWDRTSIAEYRLRLEQLTDAERIELSADIRAALQAHQTIWETQKSAKSKIALQRISVRKRLISDSLRARPPKRRHPAEEKTEGAISRKVARRLEKGDYQVRQLFWIGRELEARYGREASEDIFMAARAKVAEQVSETDSNQTVDPVFSMRSHADRKD